MKEPVDEWEEIKNENDENIIECFYKDQKKYAFHFSENINKINKEFNFKSFS